MEDSIFDRLFEPSALADVEDELNLAIKGVEGTERSHLYELLAFTVRQMPGRQAEATELQRKALALLDSEDDRLSLVRVCNRVSSRCAVLDRLEEADFYSRRAVELCPRDSPYLADSLLGLAVTLTSAGRPEEALAACDERRALGDEYDDLLDHSLRAYSLYEAGRLEEAEKAFEVLLEVDFDQGQHDDIVRHLEDIRKRLGRT
ncbi:MAG: hypothetical protein U0174_18650 [Polyangiaceae bacterium]